MTTVIRATTPEERKASFAIRRAVFVGEQGVPEEIEIDEHEESAIHFLTLLDGRPVGTGRFRIAGQQLKFERIATLSEARGKGIGRALVLEMQRVAREEYPHLIPTMHAQCHAMKFYEQLGWHGEGEPFDEAGIAHIRMVLSPA